jgi:hypothetical protein
MSLHDDKSPPDRTSHGVEASGAAARSNVATRQLLVAPAISLGLCVFWILVLAIPGALIFVLLTAPVLFMLPTRLMVLPWLAIGLAIALVVDVVGRHSQLRCSRWSVCGSALVSTVMLALLVSYPSVPDSVASTASRWVDFAFYHHGLAALVRQQHRAGQSPALAVITIDGFITIVHGIAYDESGEMALPAGRQSQRWRAAAAGGELDGDTWSATRLYGNYFWWDAQ